MKTRTHKFLIAQYGTSNLEYLPYSKSINKSYADLRGYKYYIEEDSDKIRDLCSKESIAIQWYKVPFIKEMLEIHKDIDYLLFLDLDAVVTNSSLDLEDLVSTGYYLYMTDDLGHHSLFNTGVILVKNCEESLNILEKWWESRNTITGMDVEKTLNFSGGMHKPEDPSIFKVSLWHEQTAISYMCAKDQNLKNVIKELPSSKYNSFICNNGEYIFHAYGYNFDKYRGIKDIHEALTSSINTSDSIKVVYFAYCTGNYIETIKSDIQRMYQCGLYVDLDKLLIVLSLPNQHDLTPLEKVKHLTEDLEKVEIHPCFGNKFEHYGIVKAWVEAHKFNGKLLYYHAKGVTGTYSDANEHSKWKREGDQSFKEFLKYFIIDKYKDCLNKLEDYDEVCVSDSYARGWPSGNFWWVNTKFLRGVHFPFESHYDRWACEYWLNRRTDKYSMFQIYNRFHYRDKFTYLPEDSYKNIKNTNGKKLKLNYAKLITLMEPENENDLNRPTSDHAVDFTEFVQSNLEKNNYRGFSNIQVGFDTLGRTIPDPLYGTLKSLVISFNVEGDSTEYRLVGDEGACLTYFVDQYESIGYDYSIDKGKVIREVLTTLKK